MNLLLKSKIKQSCAGLLLALTASFAHADITTGLLGWYGFENNADDSSGNARNGAATAVTYAAGRVGQAAVFNNTTSFVTVAGLSGVLPSGNSNRTVAFWVKPSSTADNGNMVSWGNSGAGNTVRFSALMEAGGELRMIGEFADTNSGFFLPTSSWTHVALTYGTTNQVQFYVNGVLQATTPVVLNTNAGAPLRIGVNAQGRNDEFFGGSIDEVRVYNRVLSAADVTELFNSTAVAGSGSSAVAPVPTLGEWGVILLSALMLRTLWIRRRRQSSIL